MLLQQQASKSQEKDVDAKGGYPVAYSGTFSGTYEPLGFGGDFDVQIQLTSVNADTTIKLPSPCSKPISR